MSTAEANVAFDGSAAARSFLQRVQQAMTGLIDGSLSTLAPIFSVAIATHDPHSRFSQASRRRSAPASAWRSPKGSRTPAS
jgi:hypothetical protein